MVLQPLFWLALLIAVPLFWMLPARIRPGFLAIVSFGYVAALAPDSALSLLGWTLAVFYAAPRVVEGKPRRAAVLAVLICGVMGYLAYFKYIPPVVASLNGTLAAKLMVPLGISYYTFKLVHYLAEVARGQIQDRSLQKFLCFMFLFPIFTAGPIERYDHFLENQEMQWSLQMTTEGLRRILFGLIKKFLIAEWILQYFNFGVTHDNMMGVLPGFGPGKTWLYLISSYMYVYMDFSSYTDFAIGASRLFGFRIMENFHYPMVAQNIADFWRRWHHTLSDWCTNYVYMPIIGLWRRPYLATYAAFAVIGLWHAGTFERLCWGCYHATGMVIFSLWTRTKRKHKWKFFDHPAWSVPAWALTQLFMCTSMAFLVVSRDESAYNVLRILAKLVGVTLRA